MPASFTTLKGRGRAIAFVLNQFHTYIVSVNCIMSQSSSEGKLMKLMAWYADEDGNFKINVGTNG